MFNFALISACALALLIHGFNFARHNYCRVNDGHTFSR